MALAVVVDRVVAVIRRHVLGDDEASAWTALGRAVVAAAAARGRGPAVLAAVRPGAPSRPPGAAADGARRGAAARACPALRRSRRRSTRRRPRRPRSLALYRRAPGVRRSGPRRARSPAEAGAAGRPQRGHRPRVRCTPSSRRQGVMMRAPSSAAAALVLAAGLFVRFTVFSGDRIRPMRWRIRLRLHPGPGFASVAELWCRWSRHAAIGHGRRARPGLRLRHRLCGPDDRLRGPPRPRPVVPPGVRPDGGPGPRHGRAADRQDRASSPTGSSTTPARCWRPAPGPTCTRRPRASGRCRGPVHVFNPQDVGGVPVDAAVGSPRPVQGPGDGPPDGVLAEGARHRR